MVFKAVFQRFLVPVACCLALLSAAIASADSSDTSLENFAKLPEFSNPKISPDGKRIAFRLVKDGRNRLIVQPVPKNGKTLDEPVRQIDTGEKHFDNFYWANNTRLVVAIRSTNKGRSGYKTYNRLTSIDVDPNGRPPVDLSSGLSSRDATYRPEFANRLKRDTSHVLAVLEHERQEAKSGVPEFSVPVYYKVNLYTGEAEKLVFRKVMSSLFLDERDRIRVGVLNYWRQTMNYNRHSLYYRKDTGSSWEQLQRLTYLDHKGLKPLRFDYDDQNILLVSMRKSGSGIDLVDETRFPIYRYDLRKRRVLGQYSNETQQKVKAMLESSLPGYQHRIVSFDDERSSYVVKSFSSTETSSYRLFDLKTNTLVKVGSENPALDSAQLAHRLEYQYTARDGMKLNAFVTMPENASQPPLVVMPRSAPFARDEEGYDASAHYLASRGYAVVQPQIRGATGYGIRYEEAGYGQWANKMQHDITDAVRWMIESGKVDGERVCIVGRGFGGYSAAWGALREPDLYRCAVSINGVLDTAMMVEENDYQLEDFLGRRLFTKRSEIREQSPYRNAESIDVPMLLIAARKDTVVPFEHTDSFYKKMKKNDKSVEMVTLEGGEHWQSSEKNAAITLRAIEQFLAGYLK